MILIYGKGKVGNSMAEFLKYTNTKYEITDDEELLIKRDSSKLTKKQQNYLENFTKIIVSPGVPPHHPIYTNYPKKIISELNSLGKFLGKNKLREKLSIIGITGTNGKSTTTHIAYETLKKLYENSNTQVHLSGNFGTPFSQTLTEIIKKNNNTYNITNPQIIVMECSSFMLYKIKKFSFDYSILTNIETDHLDRHPNKNDYKKAKINIIKLTGKKAFTIQKTHNLLPKKLASKTEIFNYDYDISKTKFVGHHNKGNLSSVFLLTKTLIKSDKTTSKTSEKKIKEIINSVSPLAHRMQLHSTINNIKIYDDSICTSAHAQENALKDLSEKTILICGGYDKGGDFEHLANLYKEKVIFGICIGQTAEKFAKIFNQQKIEYSIPKDFHEAISSAFTKAKEYQKKGIQYSITCSPGCASFGRFKNVYHRIEEFEKEIENLKKNN